MKTLMKKLKIILLIGALVIIGHQTTHAQILKKLKETAKQTSSQTVQDRTSTATGNTTNKAIDKAGNVIGGLFKKRHKNKKDKDEKDNATNDANNSNTSTPDDASQSNAAPQSIAAYQNYDFVPGDTVLFADDFTEDQTGEFPSHWNLTKGQAVVNTVAGKPTFCFTDGNYFHVDPRMKKASYLTDPFTIEFDTYCDENNSEQGSPILSLYYIDKDGNGTYGEIQFNKGDIDGRGDVSLAYFPVSLTANLPEALRNHYPDNWHHIAVIYKNNQLKCYVDQYRILVVPNLNCVPSAFALEGSGDQDHPVVITNVRVAAGGNMNMLGKKFTEAKIVTHGITFDIDKSDIKPQSMGTLNMIVGVLKANPDLKFKIDGHTDNTGEAAHNLTLSQQRAEAVKAELIKMGIDGSRLTTKGFGDTKPISDNTTPEGKANNRRVEFVKQ